MKDKTRNLWASVVRLLHQPNYRDQVKERPQDFTRDRKVEFLSLLSIILNMVRRTTQIAWDEFHERFMPAEAARPTYTKQSFAETRQKLKTEAFTFLNDAFIAQFYADDDIQTFHGFRVLAIDGSTIEIPDTPDIPARLMASRKALESSPQRGLAPSTSSMWKITE